VALERFDQRMVVPRSLPQKQVEPRGWGLGREQIRLAVEQREPYCCWAI